MPPTASKSVMITFNPNGNPTWQASEQPVRVSPGLTEITWSIQLAPNAPGSIAFDPSHGIKIKHWKGDAPAVSGANFTVTADDSLQPGQSEKTYHYGVHAIYTDANGKRENRTWDPDVEMDPP